LRDCQDGTVRIVLIEKVLGNIAQTDAAGRAVDLVQLSADGMAKPHQKTVTEAGRELKISLPRGENLFCGAVLCMDEDMVIAVDMPEEKVFELRPRTHLEWARAAYSIGNMHQSAFLHEDCIRVPYDYVLEKMIAGLAVEYSIVRRKLDGLRANAADGVHGHKE
jgi:urease accessory protein UreE